MELECDKIKMILRWKLLCNLNKNIVLHLYAKIIIL